MSLAYERHLDTDYQWAIREGSMHFEGKSAVHATLEKITRRLNELHIPYSVVGGMALFFHGLRRFTEDVDILVNREGLEKIHRELEGLGYVPLYSGSKNFPIVMGSEDGVLPSTATIISNEKIFVDTESGRSRRIFGDR